MLDKVLSLYEEKISSLPWVERYGGLARIYERTNEENTEVFPISYSLNPETCSEERLKQLIPDDSYLSLVYFEQLSSITTSKRTISRKRSKMTYSTSVRFIAWVNMPSLGIENTDDSSYLLFPSFAKAIESRVTIPEDHVLKQALNRTPRVSNLILEDKDETKNNVFGSYSFSNEAALFYPYDYFSATFDIEWGVNEQCISELKINPIDCIKL